MLDTRQTTILCGIGAAFWIADAAWIRLFPIFVVDPLWGDVGFLLSIPVAWVCARLARRVARLDGSAVVAGIVVMVAVAALLHGLALRWTPGLYGDDRVGHFGAAWLLWIYGLILGCALFMSRAAMRVRPQPVLP